MTESNDSNSNVVIIGGGFAGLTALHHLQHSLGTRISLTLIDANSHSVNRPTMPEIAFADQYGSGDR